ncbi:MAG TPA: hypothetical protein VNH17_17475 [Streptosporangiaceae bacterium]|nr:hypothetical protein [Streptosporangiaceae bacterium]
MEDRIADQRAAVIAVARGWIGTPFRHAARVKGAGVDCLQLIAATALEAGLVERIEIPHYPRDFMFHVDAETYLNGLLSYMVEVEGRPEPADVVLWKFGRCFSHGAIVVEWPTIIHAYIGRPVTLDDAERAAFLTTVGENVPEKGQARPRRHFRLKAWA